MVLGSLLLLLSGVLALRDCEPQQYSFDVKVLDTITDMVDVDDTGLTDGFLSQTLEIFNVPTGCGESFQAQASIQFTSVVFDPISSPLGASQEPAYGVFIFGVASLDSGWEFSFWLTNTKVYALYARYPQGQTAEDYYVSFAYLIPIADRTASDYDKYKVQLDGAKQQVAWIFNDYELLLIKEPGRTCVSTKFQIADYGGYFVTGGFPSQVVVRIGTGVPDPAIYTGSPNWACQQALYDSCCDNLCTGSGVECQYAEPQQLEVQPYISGGISRPTVITVKQLPMCPQCYATQDLCPVVVPNPVLTNNIFVPPWLRRQHQ